MKNTSVNNITIYSILVLLSLVAYISRIGELIPFLGMLRINLLLFVVTLSIFFLSGASQNFKWNHNPELKLLFSFLFLGYLSVPFSVWASHAFATCNTLLINCIFFLFCQSIINDRQQLFAALKIVVFSCVLLLLGLIFQPIESEIGRYTTTHTYDPNDIALLFSFSIPIVLSFYISTKAWGKILSLIVLCGLTLGIIKTGSRGGMLALGSVVGLAVCSPKLNLKTFERIFILLCVFMLLFSEKGERMRERFTTLLTGEDYNIEQVESVADGRLAIWRSGIIIFKDNYLLGVGAGNSSISMGETFRGRWRTMHNSYLQVAVELGAIAFMLFLLMVLRIHKNCNESIRNLRSRDNPDKNLISLAVSLKLSLYGYAIAGFFLSQAYSMIIPLLLAFSSQLKMIATSESDG
jgi:O-antigen ligase